MAVVEIDEECERGPCSPLVAIGQRVVASKVPAQYGSLVVDVGIEVFIVEPGLGSV